MGKFSIRRIVTMVLLIACGIVAIAVGVAAIMAKGDASNGENVNAILKDGGSFDTFVKNHDLRLPGGKDHLVKEVQMLILNGMVAKLLPYLLFGSAIVSFGSVGLGLILTKVKGKSFGIGFLIFAILTIFAVAILSFVVFKLGVNPLTDQSVWDKADAAYAKANAAGALVKPTK